MSGQKNGPVKICPYRIYKNVLIEIVARRMYDMSGSRATAFAFMSAAKESVDKASPSSFNVTVESRNGLSFCRPLSVRVLKCFRDHSKLHVVHPMKFQRNCQVKSIFERSDAEFAKQLFLKITYILHTRLSYKAKMRILPCKTRALLI